MKYNIVSFRFVGLLYCIFPIYFHIKCMFLVVFLDTLHPVLNYHYKTKNVFNNTHLLTTLTCRPHLFTDNTYLLTTQTCRQLSLADNSHLPPPLIYRQLSLADNSHLSTSLILQQHTLSDNTHLPVTLTYI